MNNQNLKSNDIRTPNERRELARKAGEASGEARRAKKTLRQELEILLELSEKGKTNQELISVGLIKQAKKGNVKAFEMIRDTIGQKPKEEIAIVEAPKIFDDIPDIKIDRNNNDIKTE